MSYGVLGEGVLGAGVLSDDDANNIRFSGGSYSAQLNPPVLGFVGQGFIAELQATLDVVYAAQFTGRGYAVTPEMMGGFILEGRGYSTTPVLSLAPDYNSFFEGYGYSAQLQATLGAIIPMQFAGRGYAVDAEMLGGFILVGQGYDASLTSSVLTSERLTFVGQSYAATLIANTDPVTSISFAGNGYAAIMPRQGFVGRGYVVTPIFSLEFDTSYAQAFVMNLNTNEVTRYTNYPFIHVARIGNEEYGFALDGIYRLSGIVDGTTKVNGQITTKDTDFNTQDFDGFQSKNVPLVYANADDTIKVTAIVDGVAMPKQTSQFAGRKTKLSRGARGRYWTMKVENITKLQGLEFLPEKLQRRVK